MGSARAVKLLQRVREDTGSLDKKDNTGVNTGLNPFYQVTQCHETTFAAFSEKKSASGANNFRACS